ncbi:unnamed protein product [Sphagnum balticum]
MFQILPNLEWLTVINRISCPHFHDLWVLSDHLFLIFHSLQSVISVLQIWISALADTTQLGLYDQYCPQSGHTASNALALPQASPYFWKFLDLGHSPTCKVLLLTLNE